MKVLEKANGVVLESENPFVTEQWKKHTDAYKPVTDKEAAQIIAKMLGDADEPGGSGE